MKLSCKMIKRYIPDTCGNLTLDRHPVHKHVHTHTRTHDILDHRSSKHGCLNQLNEDHELQLLLLLLLLLLSRFSRVRLCDPRDGSPPGSPVPGIMQVRILERVAISFSNV